MKKARVRGSNKRRSGARDPKPPLRSPGSNGENRNSKFVTREPSAVSSSFDFRISSFRAGNLEAGHGTVVIGYGNPVRSDDGFGWHASRLLARALAGEDVEVIICHQLTPEVAERLSRSNRAVFIDADCQGAPGEIHCLELQPESADPPSFTHTCTPCGLLSSAERLYGHRPEAWAITVSAQTFDFGDTLSPAVAAALPKVVDLVRQFTAWVRAEGPGEEDFTTEGTESTERRLCEPL